MTLLVFFIFLQIKGDNYMKIINASTEILTPITGDELQRIEYAGRTCYKSEDKITDD